MKKLLVFLLASFIIVTSFAGCGKAGPKSIVGTWESSTDVSEYLITMMGDSVFAGYMELDNVPLYLQYCFKEDGEFVVSINKEKTKKSWDLFLDAIMESVKKAYKAADPDGSVEDFFNAYQQEKGESMRETLAKKNDMDRLLGSFEGNGRYKVQGNRLYRSEANSTQIDETVYEIFSIKDKTLSILSSSDSQLTAQERARYPYVFSWVSE